MASIFGTEKDRVNCPFYFKIGACRHGDRCSRLHTRPTISPTLLLFNMYQRPDVLNPELDRREAQQHFDDFYEDIFEELSKHGEVQNLHVCDNTADHMIGNVYVQYTEEEDAAAALKALSGRFYAGRPIIADFSPVTDFREATCKQFEDNACKRAGYCNFMHLKEISRDLSRRLFGRYNKRYYYRGSRSRSRSRSRTRSEDKYRRRSEGRDNYHHRRRSRSRSGSPERRRKRSPIREGSAERRARIEQWNREKERERDSNSKPPSHERERDSNSKPPSHERERDLNSKPPSHD